MKKYDWVLFLLLVVIPLNNFAVESEWELRKNKNGIKIYTKEREDTHIYMYKVVTSFAASPEKIYRQVVDFRENLKYMELVDSLKSLDHRKDKRYRNYMHFDMPWPVNNREMIMEMKVQFSQNGIYLESNNVEGVLQNNEGTIPIKDFREKWKIEEDMNGNKSKITVTGWVNPGGAIPVWVVNLFSARTPYRFISGIIQELRKEQ
jgi:hypothetical protein